MEVLSRGRNFSPHEDVLKTTEFGKFWNRRELPESPELAPELIYIPPEALGRLGEAIQLTGRDDNERAVVNEYNTQTGKYIIGSIWNGTENSMGAGFAMRMFSDRLRTLNNPNLKIFSGHTHPNDSFASMDDINAIFAFPSSQNIINLIGTKYIIYGLLPTEKADLGTKISDKKERLLMLRKICEDKQYTNAKEQITEWVWQLGLAPYESSFRGQVPLTQKDLKRGIYLEKMKPLSKI